MYISTKIPCIIIIHICIKKIHHVSPISSEPIPSSLGRNASSESTMADLGLNVEALGRWVNHHQSRWLFFLLNGMSHKF